MIITDPNSDYLEYATQRTDFLHHYPASGGATSYVFPSSNWVQNNQNTEAFSIDFGNLTDGFSAQDMAEIILQFYHGAAGTDSAAEERGSVNEGRDAEAGAYAGDAANAASEDPGGEGAAAEGEGGRREPLRADSGKATV